MLVQGSDRRVEIDVAAVAVAGYTGRDQPSVQRHVDELLAQGIPAPRTTPLLFAVTADRLTQDATIDVVGSSTSGEVEFVLVSARDGELFVTVGSDHTDRELEKTDIPASKQVCPKVIGRDVWTLREIEDHWDRIEMRSWAADASAPYQEGFASALLSPRDIIGFVASRAPGPLSGVAIFSGTLPLLTPKFLAANRFRAELLDPVVGRRLSIDYAVHSLGWETDA